jgi:ketosteroid isomerase-like protein
MSDHPNLTLMQRVYEAFGTGDLAKAASYWTPDCVHHYPGRSPLAGSHAGVDQAIAFATKMFELTDGVEMEVLDVAASDDYAYALLNTRYHKGGKTLEMRFTNISRIRDGKIAEFWTYPDDQYAVDEFWAA